MLPIKATMTPDQTYAGVLEELRQVCLGAYEHRAVPFDYLLQVLDIPRSTSQNPVFQIIVSEPEMMPPEMYHAIGTVMRVQGFMDYMSIECSGLC